MATLMTAAQCRAARGMVEQSQTELAEKAGLGLSTVVDFEKSRRTLAPVSILKMQRALESAGAIFIKSGVKLRVVVDENLSMTAIIDPAKNMRRSTKKPRNINE